MVGAIMPGSLVALLSFLLPTLLCYAPPSALESLSEKGLSTEQLSIEPIPTKKVEWTLASTSSNCDGQATRRGNGNLFRLKTLKKQVELYEKLQYLKASPAHLERASNALSIALEQSIFPLVEELFHESDRDEKRLLLELLASHASPHSYPLLRSALHSGDWQLQTSALIYGKACPHPSWRHELLRKWREPGLHPHVKLLLALATLRLDPDEGMERLKEVEIFNEEMRRAVIEEATWTPSLLEIEELLAKELSDAQLLTLASWLKLHQASKPQVHKLLLKTLHVAASRGNIAPSIYELLAPALIVEALQKPSLQQEAMRSLARAVTTTFALRPWQELLHRLSFKEGAALKNKALGQLFEESLLHDRSPYLFVLARLFTSRYLGADEGEKAQLGEILSMLSQQQLAFVHITLEKNPSYQDFLAHHLTASQHQAMVEKLLEGESHQPSLPSSSSKESHAMLLSLYAYKYLLDRFDQLPFMLQDQATTLSLRPRTATHLSFPELRSLYLSNLLHHLEKLPSSSIALPYWKETLRTSLINLHPKDRLFLLFNLGRSREKLQELLQQVACELGIALSPSFLSHSSPRFEARLDSHYDSYGGEIEDREASAIEKSLRVRSHLWHALVRRALPPEAFSRWFPLLNKEDQVAFFSMMAGDWDWSHLPFLIHEIETLRPRQHLTSHIRYLSFLYVALLDAQNNGPSSFLR